MEANPGVFATTSPWFLLIGESARDLGSARAFIGACWFVLRFVMKASREIEFLKKKKARLR